MADCDMNLIGTYGSCRECDAMFEAKNAQGLAAQHADRYGHEVEVELTYSFTARPD